MRLIHGDCLEQLKLLDVNSVDALITDPPAGIAFMNKEWDKDKGGRVAWVTWMTTVMRECYRVMKPGAHGLVWAIPRTSHWMAWAIEDAGFEIRDVVTHVFGSGFPKSLDVSKSIDRAANAEREIIGMNHSSRPNTKKKGGKGFDAGLKLSESAGIQYISAPATDEAKQWQGFGTALKPASEHWVLCRKPLSENTVAANVLKHGTGAINIDGSRIGIDGGTRAIGHVKKVDGRLERWDENYRGARNRIESINQGRFPANFILSHSDACDDECAPDCPVMELERQSIAGGMHSAGKARPKQLHKGDFGVNDHGNRERLADNRFGDSGGASRFFYCAKTAKSERNAGLDRFEIVSIFGAWENADLLARLQVDTEHFPPKVTAVFGTSIKSVSEWNTFLFGNKITDQSQKECKSTIKTELNSIIESKTLNWLLRSNISANILDANCVEIDGGSPADLVTDSNLSSNFINAKTVTVTNAKNAQSPARFRIKSDGAYHSTHPTVKAVKLMKYLCRMITPPGGIVLDPFLGSGSTGVAATACGFDFIGIELDHEYLKIAEARINHGNAQCSFSTQATGF